MNETVQRLEKICSDADTHSKSSMWKDAESFFAEADRLWRELDSQGTYSVLKEQFDEACRHFHSRHEAHKLRKARISERESLCESVEKLAGRNDAEAAETAAEAARKWHLLEPIPPEYMEIVQARFNKALKDFQDRKDALDREKALFDSRAADIENCCAAMERLASDGNPVKGAKHAEKTRKKWAELTADLHGVDALKKRFADAYKAFVERKERFVAEFNAAVEKEEKELKDLCDELQKCVVSENLREMLPKVKELRGSWKKSALEYPGKEHLVRRFEKLINTFYSSLKAQFEEEDWARWENYTHKLTLCEKAEKLIAETDCYVKSRAVNELRHEWKEVGSVPKEKSDEIWQRFHSACEKIQQECGEFFIRLKAEREENLKAKTAICEEAEKLAGSTDWNSTAAALKALQQKWKDTGRAEKEDEEPLFQRFRKVCDDFFTRRKEHYKQIHERNSENKKAKVALCEKAESLAGMADWHEAFKIVREIKLDWKDAGFCGRDEEGLWNRLNAAFDAFFQKINGQRPVNLAAKQQLCDEIEAAIAKPDAETDFDSIPAKAAELRRKWDEIGPGPKDEEKALYEKFCALLARLEDRRLAHLNALREAREQNIRLRIRLISQVEGLAEKAKAGQDIALALDALKAEWNNSGDIPEDAAQRLNRAFTTACGEAASGNSQFFNRLKDKRQKDLKQKRELCVEIERLANISASGAASPEKEVVSEDVLSELKFALESNIISHGNSDRRSHRDRTDLAQDIKKRWDKINSDPSDEDEALNQRFARALNKLSPRKS